MGGVPGGRGRSLFLKGIAKQMPDETAVKDYSNCEGASIVPVHKKAGSNESVWWKVVAEKFFPAFLLDLTG